MPEVDDVEPRVPEVGGEEPRGYDPAGSTVPWRSFAEEARVRLRAAGVEPADTDARRIVERAAGVEGADYFAALDQPATKRGVVAFDRMLERRLLGEPLQYVVGRWGFRSLDLMVDARVLIPRPETEVVAGVALAELGRIGEQRDEPVVVDLGTGSGAIGLSIAAECVSCRVVITDVSPDALAVARANLAGLGQPATRVTALEGSWFDALPATLRGEVDVLVSNPPYVAAVDDLPAAVRDWEPLDALIAGDEGRDDLAHLMGGAGEWLRPGGALVLELDPGQAAWAMARVESAGFVDVAITRDLAGRDRVITGRWPS